MRKNFVLGSAATFMAIGAVAGALAHGGATGVVAERMNGMMMLQEQIKLLNPMFNGEADLDTPTVVDAARMIVQHAGEAMLSGFPEGSIEGPSEAKPAIWTEWENFSQEAMELSNLGEELIETVSAPPRPLQGTTTITPATEQATPAPLTSWEQMSLEVLLGLKSREQFAAEQEAERRDASQLSENAPTVRPAQFVFADIVNTCSSCHNAYRQ